MFEILTGVLTLAVQDGSITESPAVEIIEKASDPVAIEATGAAISGGMAFGIFVFGLILAFVAGAFVAKAMKMTDWGFRFGVCFAALAIGVMPFLVRALNGESIGDGIRLGIDLAGGTNMLFRVKGDDEKPVTNEVMDKMVGAVGKRIDPSGTSEITVRQVGADRLEVIVPGEDPQTVNEIKKRITRLGTLEFFITANQQLDDKDVIRRALALENGKTKIAKTLPDGEEIVQAMWLPAYEKGDAAEPQLLGRTDVPRREVEKFRTVDGKKERYTTEEYLVLVGPPEQQVSGKYLKSASSGIDPENGGQMVRFQFDTRGAHLFSILTSKYGPQPGRPRRGLGIVLDKQLYSAPDINAVISSQGQITGNFTSAEVKELTSVLNAGALEVPIEPKPLSEATVDPTLGEDVRRKGVQAIMLAGAVVVVFMLFYYRFAGVVAVLSLFLNLVLVLTIMMAINATFTLPGLAGLVLTIGMAVDANVLIFERMREETTKGSGLKTAIQNGFGKAFTTIVDANVTTLITAVILYAIGTDQVKGFAVSLFIGIVVSMFTALYVGRVIFDVCEKQGWLSKLSMASIVGQTNWNFLGKRSMCAIISLVLIVGGLAAFGSRGEGNYDIDFTGGTMVTFQLTETAETSDVETALKEQFGDGFTVERLTLAGEEESEGSKHFRLRTTVNDSDENADEKLSAEDRVRKMVFDSFKDNDSLNLLRVTMDYGTPEAYVIAEDDDSADALEYARFSGGQIATVSFDKEVAIGTISDMIGQKIGELKDGEQAKYEEADAVYTVTGTDGSGLDADEREVQTFSEVAVRVTPEVPAEDLTAALTAMKAELDSSPLFDEVNTFASAVASEMKTKAVLAIVISLLAIVAYIWFRFQKITFGLAAVVALVHDVLIVLGMMALAAYLSGNPVGQIFLLNDFKINLPMVAAFLTIVGYSLNDTIVVFDRIREVRGKNPNLTTDIVNTSLNQTLSRTLLTSLTTFIVVIILYFFGGEGIHGFSFCLTLGVIVGTYSSIYVASPVLVWLMNRESAKAVA
ncbi:MAG: protein translocase subunit SecD [Planctomycetaceae bacterium]|nr:protein translocase subunit SecD [Planctomycetaceae bacterium]